MRAIDFACRFLARIAQDDMTPASRQVMLAVAAGLNNSHDIAEMTGLSMSSCTAILRQLSRQKVLACVSRESGVYLLAPDGKERVRRLLTFFSSPPPCGRSDI